jgi:hypothetical protein
MANGQYPIELTMVRFNVGHHDTNNQLGDAEQMSSQFPFQATFPNPSRSCCKAFFPIWV